MGVIGAGAAAVLHAEAARAARSLELFAVAARPGSPRARVLAAALGCAATSVAELGRHCDLAVVAVPPTAVAAVTAEVASGRRVQAVMVESPAATTIDGLAALAPIAARLPVMAAANLLHAAATRQALRAIAAMRPHHLALEAAVPRPRRASGKGGDFGGGVLMHPGASLWPLLLAALAEPVESVSTLRLETSRGVDRHVEALLLASSGSQARARLRWDAEVATASLEAADSAHAARLDFWPVPSVEFDGAPLDGSADGAHPLEALGFVPQLERLDRVARGEAALWPGLDVSAAALSVAAAAAASARARGAPVVVRDAPRDIAVDCVLNGAA